MARINLAQMNAGQSGTIIHIHGGRGMRNRLESMGLRPDARITKVSAQIMQGPVIVKTGNTRIAIGFGMARRIIIEID
jgi:ferrous iron transport protein A